MAHYESSATTLGALQRGLGRGVFGDLSDALAVLRDDYRWDGVDERAVYLARLVRDFDLPVPSLTSSLQNLDVLSVLGRCGVLSAVDALHDYVRSGPQWVEVLETVAVDWPLEMWDDLRPVALARLAPGARVWGKPWKHWGLAAPLVRPARRLLGDRTTEELLALLSDDAVRELNRRGPHPALLDLAGSLPPLPSLCRSLELLGALAVPLARTWAAQPDHPLRGGAVDVLALHGDDSDLSAIFAEWDRLDHLPDFRCGYDTLAAGVARIGARAAVPRLRKLWYSPHSYERAAYLRALNALDPEVAGPFLAEGLWDCESEVRLFAVEHATVSQLGRLAFLRDDPMETASVRAAAASRISSV
ncbi:HEAT repeat domain-containing protein [Winogradskya humida]|nr:HEAT repeat domain-containing protein [Actinoplanes humidus]